MKRRTKSNPPKLRTFRCMFCENEFTADEICFCLNDPNSNTDSKFEEFTQKFKSYGSPTLNRRFFEKGSWLKQGQIWEMEGEIPLLPLQVYVEIPEEQGINTNDPSNHSIGSVTPVKDNDVASNTDTMGYTHIVPLIERACPHCHCLIPQGFATYRKLQIGMLGGRRCGKTTYIVMACMNLNKRLDNVDGLQLANVEVLPESRAYLERLYDDCKDQTSATEIDPTILEKPVFPIILRFNPTDTRYKPFFISFQDIPGELMQANPGSEQKLRASPIMKSDAIFALVDANMIQLSEPHEKELRKAVGDENKKHLDFCSDQFSDVYGHLKDFLLDRLPQLKSLQIVITKLDEYLPLQQNNLNAKRMRILDDCTREHVSAINEDCLDVISSQLRVYFDGKTPPSNPRPNITAMEDFLRKSFTSSELIYTACSAVSSRSQKGTIEPYLDTLNILDPIFRFFYWEGLLPHNESNDIPCDQPLKVRPSETFMSRLLKLFR